jgi:diguanylate cyclase (GGDEF)-like protein
VSVGTWLDDEEAARRGRAWADESGLLAALDALARLPALEPRSLAGIARSLAPCSRAAMLVLRRRGYAGCYDDGEEIRALSTSAPNIASWYVGDDLEDGLVVSYSMVDGPWLCARVSDGENVYGALLLEGMPERPNLATERSIRAFASVLGLKIALSAQIDEALRMAETDGLTGLFVKRVGEDYFAKMMERKQPLTLVFLDLNGFKQINDEYGHPAGDKVLIRAAKALRSACRVGDVAVRCGGDEFVVLAKEYIEERLTARIRLAFEPTGISASIGSCLAPEEAEAFEEAYDLADKRMYEQKRAYKETHGIER